MDLISIFPAFWTAGADTATGTTDLVPSVQDVVDTMGEEVKQTSSILSRIFQPILDKLPSLIFAVLFLLIGMFLVKQIMRILKRAFNRSNMDGIMSSFIRSVAKIILYVLLIVIALSILDVPMDSIVAVIASAGVAIGLALKDSLSNLAGGFIILFSKPLKEGDTIEADGVMGKVGDHHPVYPYRHRGQQDSVHPQRRGRQRKDHQLHRQGDTPGGSELRHQL